jgi:hypothetical protein
LQALQDICKTLAAALGSVKKKTNIEEIGEGRSFKNWNHYDNRKVGN